MRTGWRYVIGACAALVLAGVATAEPGRSQPPPLARAARTIYFFRNPAVLTEPRVRPTRITFNADGNNTVTGLHWHGWGTGVARGNGTDHFDNCSPSCAQGHILPIPAHVTLYSPGRFRARDMYRCYHVYFTVQAPEPAFRFCL
jgi:hypothetical protein